MVRFCKTIWVIVLLLGISCFALGQDDIIALDIEDIAAFTAIINDDVPRRVFTFNAQRDQILHIQVTATDGDLDPVVTVLDPTGEMIFRRDDAQGSYGVDALLTTQRTGEYTLIVGRFGDILGTTAGDFELRVQDTGATDVEVLEIAYGDSELGRITSTKSTFYYTFSGQPGDIINIQMVRSSGNLDAHLQLVNRDGVVLAENDDARNTSTKNSRIENFIVDEAGTYIIIASRYGQAEGDSTGSFILSIGETDESGLGNTAAVPIPLSSGVPVRGELDGERYERYYSFFASRNDIVSIGMAQTAGFLDTYLVIADLALVPFVEDDNGGIGSNAFIQEFRVPSDGQYYVIAGRKDGVDGTTVGEYELTFETSGQAFNTIPGGMRELEYGSVVEGRIDDAVPQELYAFWGIEGDRVLIEMNAVNGNLDSVVELLNENQQRITRDDDGGTDQNARLEFTLTYSGVHFIRATRFSGGQDLPTSGQYELRLNASP